MSFFESLELLPEDPILSLPKMFAADPRPIKVNLGVGVYQDTEGNPVVFSSVRRAEEHLSLSKFNKNYAPIDGAPDFISSAVELIFDINLPTAPFPIYAAQSIGGTGALRLGAEFLSRNGVRTIYVPNPSWPNHHIIFSYAKLEIEEYPYYDPITHRLSFTKMCERICEMSPGSCILLHACCHNPSGIDLTDNEWKIVAELIKKHQLIPFIDFAYQGFGKGFEEDATPLRHLYQSDQEMLLAYSFSKNMGLYGERVGLLAICSNDKQTIAPIGSQIKQTIRSIYSTPPLHGARVVQTILQDPQLKANWQSELAPMRQRIASMRMALVEGLSKLSHQNFSYLKDQQGLFSFFGLNRSQVNELREKYAIYLPPDGRINIAGLNPNNIDYVTEALSNTKGNY